jgi:phage terminase large subunit GpA-like protein
MIGAVLTPAEKGAFFPPQKLTPSEWAEKNRKLPSNVAAESGDYRISRTPYMRGILDAFCEIGVEEIAFLKPAQVGWTTALETLIGWAVDNEPGPALLVLDSEKTGKEIIDERIRPLIQNTEALKRHASDSSDDDKLTSIRFDTMQLSLGWAGSPATLASRAIRYVFFDEVDKYPHFSGREADPISLATERTQTYGYRRKVLIGSTPTTRDGTIWRAYSSAGDKRLYYVPCPHCSAYQVLAFTQIKYPKLEIEDKNRYADVIEHQSLAYYECLHCQMPIKESAKPKMLLRGVWLSDGQTIDKEGKIAGNRPRAKRVGFWINGLYSPWRTFSSIAAEHRRSLNDPGRMQNFKNSVLGECFEEIIKSASVEDYRKLKEGAPAPNIVPVWAKYIIAAADVHKESGKAIAWNIRAWGAGYRSQLIDSGTSFTFDDLKAKCLDRQIELATGGTSRSHLLVIDAGYRTDEVYAFGQTDDRIYVVKGENDKQHGSLVAYSSTVSKQQRIRFYTINTQLLKDRLSTLRKDEGRWSLNASVTDEYLHQLASEHKVFDRKANRELWEKKSKGAANEALDLEVYSLAGAEIARVDQLIDEDKEQEAPQPESIKPAPQQIEQRNSTHSSWLGNTRGFLKR